MREPPAGLVNYTAPVLNVQERKTSGLPARSRTEDVATLYVVLAASVTDGFSVAVRVVALYVTVAVTTGPVRPPRRSTTILLRIRRSFG